MSGFKKLRKAGLKGNRIRLLENGEQFFPQLIRRIRQAKKEIFLETFILTDDRVGKILQKALICAARRGVWISITVDSYGTYFLPEEYIQSLIDEGIIFQVFSPQPPWFYERPNIFRRLHRKLAVIDAEHALIGGINLCHDHMLEYGEGAKQDYGAEIQGPVVPQIRQLCKSYVRESSDQHLGELIHHLHTPEQAGKATIAFLFRDNHRHRTDIEKAYIDAIRSAKKRILIANAYFFPGFRLMRALYRAAQRGVEVKLVMQGAPDIALAAQAARSLYGDLTNNGVQVFEYTARHLHAKIAIIDDEWATIGSSNLDPLSLSLNLEANVFVLDSNFNSILRSHIQALLKESRLIQKTWLKRRTLWHLFKSFLIYHVLRHVPSLITWFPKHRPKIRGFKSVRQNEPANTNKQVEKQYPEARHARRMVAKQDYLEVEEI